MARHAFAALGSVAVVNVSMQAPRSHGGAFVHDESAGISQSAVRACPSGGSANGCRSTTWLLGALDVETRPSLRTPVQPASTAFCETHIPEGLNIRMQFFIASASTRFCETLKRGRDYSQSLATVIFITSVENTYSHCQPPFWKPGGRRSPLLQASRWHYAVADECDPLVFLDEGMDEPFVIIVTTATTALPEAPFFTMPNVLILFPQN